MLSLRLFKWQVFVVFMLFILFNIAISKIDSLSDAFYNKSCSSSPDKVFSREETVLRFIINKFCGRALLTADRLTFYNEIKNGEINVYELIHLLRFHSDCPHIDVILANRSAAIQARVAAVDLNNWQTRMPDQVYSWTVDFHPSPASCNINLYSEIGE